MKATRRTEPVPDLVRVPAGCVDGWRLTPRQAEVLQCLCAGYANKEIAERLRIALPTVLAHVSAILQRSDSDSRTRVVAKVLSYPLVPA